MATDPGGGALLHTMKPAGQKTLVGLAAACAVVAVWLAVRHVYRYSDVSEVREKLAWFLERKNTYDVVMVGASGIRSQVAPEAFDRVAAQAGCPVRSFNMGFSDMVPPETFYILDRIAEARPRRLRYVVLGVEPIRVDVSRDGMRTAKVAYWHSPRHTMTALRSLWRSGASLSEKVRHSWRHLALCLRNVAQSGKGPAAMETLFGGRRMDMSELGPLRDGFISYDAYVSMGRGDVRSVVEQFRTQQRAYRESERRSSSGAVDAVYRLDSAGLRSYAEMTRRLQAQGILTFVVVLPRILVDTRDLLRVAQCPGVMGAIDLNDPVKYPEFFRFENKSDAAHVNEQTALLLTARVAEAFAAGVAGKK